MKHLCVAAFLAAAPLTGQTPGREFEVASIKLATDCGGRSRGPAGGMPTRGRLNFQCASVEDLISMAYVIFAHGDKPEMRRVKIEGGPAWMRSEQYSINAKAEDAAPIMEMYGPMLRALLADRFQLKLHTENRESAVYLLTVAKSGIKLQPTPDGSCTPIDLDHLPAPGQTPPKFCGNQSMSMSQRMAHFKATALTPKELASGMFSNLLDRPVVDKTGLDGRYDFDLQFAPDSSMPMFSGMGGRGGGAAEAGPATAAADPEGPSIFTALDKIGLKLEPGKGRVEVIVIDALERLREN